MARVNGTAYFFNFHYCRGRHKYWCYLSQFTTKTFVLWNSNVLFEHCIKVRTLKMFWLQFMFKNVLLTFSELPYLTFLLYYIKMCAVFVQAELEEVTGTIFSCNLSTFSKNSCNLIKQKEWFVTAVKTRVVND